MSSTFIVMIKDESGNLVEDNETKTLRLNNRLFTMGLGWMLTPYLTEYHTKLEPKILPKGWDAVVKYLDLTNNFHKLIIARANHINLVELETSLPFRPLTIMDGEYLSYEECKSLNHDFRIWQERVFGQSPGDRQLMIHYRQLADFFKQVTKPNQVVRYL